MNDAAPDFLSQLRDIHGASEPGWWPPAPGWWVVAVIALLILIFALRYFGKRLAARRRRARLLRALEHIRTTYDPDTQAHEYLAQINRLFRVVALRAFPGTASTRLQGEPWVGFLRSLLPESQADSLDALVSGPYQPAPGLDAEGLYANAREWVKRYG